MILLLEPIISYTYGVPYFCIIIFGYILTFFSRKKSEITKSVLIFIFILIIFFGLRGFVQTDCLNYINIYERIPNLWNLNTYNQQSESIEYGFLIYTSLIKSIYPDFHLFVFINTIIDVIIFTWFFKRYSSFIILSWIVFFIFSGLVIELNLYRNVKAICIFLLSLPYIEQRNFSKFFILWFCAIMFHVSAIFYLPTYFILMKNWGRFVPIIMLIAVNIIFFLKLFPTTFLFSYISGADDGFVTKALDYLNNGKEQGITLGYIERLTMYVLCLVFGKRLIAAKKHNLLFINSFYIYYVLWYIFSDVTVFVERFPLLYSYSYWIIIPNLLSICKKVYKNIFALILFLFLSAKMFILTDHILYKYDNILFGIDNISNREFNKDRYMLNK